MVEYWFIMPQAINCTCLFFLILHAVPCISGSTRIGYPFLQRNVGESERSQAETEGPFLIL